MYIYLFFIIPNLLSNDLEIVQIIEIFEVYINLGGIFDKSKMD